MQKSAHDAIVMDGLDDDFRMHASCKRDRFIRLSQPHDSDPFRRGEPRGVIRARVEAATPRPAHAVGATSQFIALSCGVLLLPGEFDLALVSATAWSNTPSIDCGRQMW